MKKMISLLTLLSTLTFMSATSAATLSWRHANIDDANLPLACKSEAISPSFVMDQAGNKYQITSDVSGVQKMLKNTARWVTIDQGLGPADLVMVLALGVDVTRKNIFAATYSGLYTWVSESNIWVQVKFPQASNEFLFWLNPKTNRLYLYNKNSGIYVLNPKTLQWKLIDDNAGLLPFMDKYGSGTAPDIDAIGLEANGKLCVHTNWGIYVQK